MFQKIDRMITTVDNFKYYKHSVLCEKILKGAIAHITENNLTFLPEYQQYFQASDALKIYFKNYNPNGMPFEKYASEPVFVKNLKDLLNAIYLLQKTFEDLESVDIREGEHKILEWHDDITKVDETYISKQPFWKRWWLNTKNSVWNGTSTVTKSFEEANTARDKLWNETIPKAYQASHLITHLDLSLFSAFLPEYDSLKSAIEQLQQLSEHLQTYTEITPKKVQGWVQPEQIGSVIGEGLYQLKAEGGSFDISFLTHLGASLPSFFQQITYSLKKFSPDLAQLESSITQQQLDSFEEMAEKILVTTEKLTNRNAFVLPFYVLHCIRLLQDIVALGRGIVEQFSLANETSKDVVIEKLRKLKHEYIGALFLSLDKTEAELMLKPGTLSGPWMATMTDYWKVIARYANNIIDLQEKAPDLLTLNDCELINRRKAALEKRCDRNKAYFAVNSRRMGAFLRFYKCLKSLESGNSVSKEDLTELAQHYLMIQRFVIATRPKLHATLVDNFFSEHAIENHTTGMFKNIYQYIPYTVSWSKCKSELLAIEKDIEDAINSASNTPLLNQKIARSLCDHLDSTAGLPLIPLQREQLPPINEEKDDLIRTYMNLYEAQREQDHLKKALHAYKEFETKLNDLLTPPIFHIRDLSESDRKTISELYAFLQPYLYSCVGQSQQNYWRYFDKKMIQALTGDVTWLQEDKSALPITDVLNKLSFFKFKLQLQEQLQLTDERVSKLKLTQREKIDVYKEELQYVDSKVVLERAKYVFKWDFVPMIPTWIQEQRTELFEWVMNNYSDAITKELKNLSTTGLPFPEIEDPFTRLRQPHQLVLIKQVFNALYYLELCSQQLADLREDSYQSVYVYQLLQAYDGIEHIYELGLVLNSDPYLLAFIRRIQEQFKKVQHSVYEHALPYQTSAIEVDHHKQQPVKWSALWYTIQTLRVMPGHIETRLQGKQIDEMGCFDASYSAKKTCLEIEDLLNKSDSYLLVFLSLPQISRLSYQLRDECLSLGQQVHHSVVDRLKEIQDGPLTDILIEADKLETDIGLKSGTISEPIRKILSKFFAEMVFQQQLSSESTFDILFSKNGRVRRMNSIINKKEDRLTQMDQRKHYLELLEPALKLMKKYHNYPKKMTISEKFKFVSWIQANIKTIKQLEAESNFPTKISRIPDTAFEQDIYGLWDFLKTKFPNFEYRLQRLNAQLCGENSSNLFTIEKEEHQLAYLVDENRYPAIVKTERKEQMKRFIELQFNKIAIPFLGRTIGIANLGKDYTSRLGAYINEERKRILDEIYENSIDDLVKQDLVKLTEDAASRSIITFVETYYSDYVLLCEFLKQLQLCRAYCSELSVNEQYGPKQAKFDYFLKLLENLDEIATDESLTPAERINKLKKDTQKDSNFYSRLMNIRNDVEPFTWLWLKQCVEDLLAILHIRQSTRQSHFDNICSSLEKPPVPLKMLYKANGFFNLKNQDSGQQSEQQHLSDPQPNDENQSQLPNFQTATPAL